MVAVVAWAGVGVLWGRSDRVGLYRAASAAGLRMDVIAPGKTPRGRSDRVKTDRKDAELLARCLIAGSLTAIQVPSVEVEAARELVRRHDMCRRDLMNARHRVTKMLLRHGRVYPKPSSTWTKVHRQWLAAQPFSDPISELERSVARVAMSAESHPSIRDPPRDSAKFSGNKT